MASIPPGPNNEEPEIFTPQEMREWLQREMHDVMKAAELRVKEATDFVTKYATGEISYTEMHRRENRYNSRWADALFGISGSEGMSNEEIVARMDQNHELSLQRSRAAKGLPMIR